MKKIRCIISRVTTALFITMVVVIQSVDADEVIHDDAIIEGNGCIGLNCQNGEPFGDEVLKLKDVVLRIKFEDTSTGGFYATNDWQIAVNDKNEGGADRFSIEDIDGGATPFTIEAGAPDASLYVDPDGHIGLGTDNPSRELHLVSGNTPTVLLEQDGSVWTPQKWEVGGHEAYFFIYDETNDEFPFKIDDDTPSNTLKLTSSGNVGLGTNAPTANLHLAGRDNDATFLFETDGNGWYMLNKNASGRLNITDDPTFARVPFKIGMGAQQNLLKVGCGVTDQVYINGNLVVAGTITPDYVFEDRYPLPSIEEHADFMWKEKHLPAVEKAKVDEEGKGVVNLGKRSQELLEELETAHIYIQQLNQKIKELESLNSIKVKELEDRLAKIEG